MMRVQFRASVVIWEWCGIEVADDATEEDIRNAIEEAMNEDINELESGIHDATPWWEVGHSEISEIEIEEK